MCPPVFAAAGGLTPFGFGITIGAQLLGAGVSFLGQRKAAKAAKSRAAETTAARQRTEALQKRREDFDI